MSKEITKEQWEDLHKASDRISREREQTNYQDEKFDIDEFLSSPKTPLSELYKFMEERFHTLPHKQAFDSLLTRISRNAKAFETKRLVNLALLEQLRETKGCFWEKESHIKELEEELLKLKGELK